MIAILNAGFQYLEQRDKDDNIVKEGVVSKESPFTTADNTGIYDVIAENLRVLEENLNKATSVEELSTIRDEVKEIYNKLLTDDSFSSADAKEQADIAKEQAGIATDKAKEATKAYNDLKAYNEENIAPLKVDISTIKEILTKIQDIQTDIDTKAATIDDQASEVEKSVTRCATSERNAKNSETGAKTSEDNAKLSETKAKDSENNAKTSEANAKVSEYNAKISEDNAKASESATHKYKEDVSSLLTNLSTQVSTAKEYADYVKKMSDQWATNPPNENPSTEPSGPTTVISQGDGLTFDKIADLENDQIEAKENDRIRFRGYYKPGDGGGANYICSYVPDVSSKPWAIYLCETDEVEYEIKKDINGTPVLDENGDYIFETDTEGAKIPVLDDNGKEVHKKLYALLDEKVINYRMFGAKLDGKTDDYDAIMMAHRYQSSNYSIEPISKRKHYYVKLENHEGIIRKDNNEPIQCHGNIDLSGSELYVQDCNATWFGFYLWGDNETDYWSYEPTDDSKKTYTKDNFVIGTEGKESHLEQNALIFLQEEPYAVRDDSGYLYSEPRYELLLHTTDGVLANPITYDWNNAGGLEIKSSLSSYEGHAASTQTVNSKFTISYNMLPSTHYEFVGCNVKLATSANKYCSVLWCKTHNAHIRGFNFYPDSNQMHNTVFKNTMIYVWGCYNTEISDIVGFNAAGKMQGSSNGTSGYMIRATNCLDLHIHDVSMQGYWGATAMNCVKDIHIERVNANRLDIHNYFQNLYIDHCNLFNHAIQIGEGRGICQITNSNFYVNELPNDSYPNAHILEFNTTYGRIFEGRVVIENCDAWLKKPGGKEFDVCKIDFNKEAVSTLDTHKFPEITIRDCNFHSYEPDTYLVYFMVAGKRYCKTSGQAPTTVVGQCKDTGNDDKGTLRWKLLGRGIDWTEAYTGDGSVSRGQFIRTFDRSVDASGLTSFYNTNIFFVTKGGKIPTISEDNKPSDLSGKEFSLGSATVKYVEWNEWQANKDYSVGDCCYTSESSWKPLTCWECISAGHSNGYRPVHTSGKVIEGVDTYPQCLDACYWEYVDTKEKFVTKTFSPSMEVAKNDIIYADHRLYKVLKEGILSDKPPIDTAWHGSFDWGTAKLGFIGKDWFPKTWWEKDSYVISQGNDGVERVYKLVDQDGTTSGRIPVNSNARCVDGDIIWEWISSSKQGTEWKANTSYNLGDIVYVGDNSYKCVFDGKLEMPSQIVLQNITTNMKAGGDVFAFWEGGTDVPTKCNASGKWIIKVDNVDFYRFRTFKNGYFGHSGNILPTTIECNLSGTKITLPSAPTPSTDSPSTDEPSTDNPSTDNPSTDTPSTDNPSTDNPSTDKPSTDNPSTDNPSNPSTDTPTVEGSIYQKSISFDSDKVEDWSAGDDCMFKGPSGRKKVLIKATTNNGAFVTNSSYLCFIDSDWTKEIQVKGINNGVVVDITPGKEYRFCYWLSANKACSINVSIIASDEVDAMTSSEYVIPAYA
ncbi:putative phage tail protein (plasmid) [Selenomonas ruminantium subsp. lactilytica TAM6421]|uniref:Putative phage tail protein n=1 Tax=Selenomonas ruminantium subsp. lactilytica (strain NBRC 103574 / TAM6421) TaxID=927704 RepID=I0GWF1_SELRL|nr:putative phage tail protein [Selenomonas ruminantium]BAL85088.1 putative phage tail protein [Selenomonas ruminantium subsp. lactilytica TAM6421]